MKSLAVIAAMALTPMALTPMAAGCVHEPPIGGAKAGSTGSVPRTKSVEV
jgi:hypothetical protein